MSATGDRERGFTLLEVLVVLAIVGFISALAFPMARRSVSSIALADEAVALKAGLMAARASAFRSGQRVDVVVAADGGSWRWGATVRQLPDPLRAASATTPAVSFWPDGGATGGGVDLVGETARRTVTADGSTGVIAMKAS